MWKRIFISALSVAILCSFSTMSILTMEYAANAEDSNEVKLYEEPERYQYTQAIGVSLCFYGLTLSVQIPLQFLKRIRSSIIPAQRHYYIDYGNGDNGQEYDFLASDQYRYFYEISSVPSAVQGYYRFGLNDRLG